MSKSITQPKCYIRSHGLYVELFVICLQIYFIFFPLIYLFYLEANYLMILWWFLPYINMNQPRVYMCPPCLLNTPSTSLPPHPSGLSQCTGFECSVSCIKHGLVIYFTYGIYMFQCYSSKSSHLRLLPQSPKVCSLHLCLFCCLTYRVIVTIFLNSIYMH